MPISSQSYPIGDSVGRAVIINNWKVHGLKDLYGADKDAENMNNLWRTLGFEVDLIQNISAKVCNVLFDSPSLNNFHMYKDLVMRNGPDLCYSYKNVRR